MAQREIHCMIGAEAAAVRDQAGLRIFLADQRHDLAQQVSLILHVAGDAHPRMATRFFGLPAGGPAVALPPNLSKHENFQSRFLPDERTIIVYVPPDYDDEPQRRYPVLYLQDGQNLFDAKTAFGGTEWCADETADELVESGEVEPLIIAGIYNTGERRIEEYTPSRNVKLGGGKAQLYGHMLG